MTRSIPAMALLLALATPVFAQTDVDVSRLPVDLERIHRGLQQTATREERDGLNFRYYVNVNTQAPPLVVFGPEDNLVHGPVPYGGPTHRDMLEQMTPKEYRAPAADFSAFLRWLAERAPKR
jgi:hypothetical protein